MRYSFIIIMAIALTSCATVAPTEDVSVETESSNTNLPPQKLVSGECGLFIWTGGETRSFVGFESQTQGKIILEGETLSMTRTDDGALESLQREYETENSQALSLNLQEDETIKDGIRFQGRLTSQTDEGWDRVTPVIALLSCVP